MKIKTLSGFEYDEKEVIAQITWTVTDIKSAIAEEKGCRIEDVTDEEVDAVLENMDEDELEDISIGHGWDYINNVVEETFEEN